MTLDVLRNWCGPMTRRWIKDDVERWDELPRDHQQVRVLVAVLIAISELAGLLVATVALGVAVFRCPGHQRRDAARVGVVAAVTRDAPELRGITTGKMATLWLQPAFGGRCTGLEGAA